MKLSALLEQLAENVEDVVSAIGQLGRDVRELSANLRPIAELSRRQDVILCGVNVKLHGSDGIDVSSGAVAWLEPGEGIAISPVGMRPNARRLTFETWGGCVVSQVQAGVDNFVLTHGPSMLNAGMTHGDLELSGSGEKLTIVLQVPPRPWLKREIAPEPKPREPKLLPERETKRLSGGT